MPKTDESTTPRIYVASLSDYNAGTLHGEWIDADQDADAIHEAIQAMLAKSSEPIAEEWAIHDYDNFEGIRLSEYEDIERVATIGQALAEADEPAALAAWLANDPGYNTPEGFEEAYRGHYDTVEHYADELVDEGLFGPIPDAIASYIDTEAIARDLELGGDIWTAEAPTGGVYIFDNHA